MMHAMSEPPHLALYGLWGADAEFYLAHVNIQLLHLDFPLDNPPWTAVVVAEEIDGPAGGPERGKHGTESLGMAFRRDERSRNDG